MSRSAPPSVSEAVDAIRRFSRFYNGFAAGLVPEDGVAAQGRVERPALSGEGRASDGSASDASARRIAKALESLTGGERHRLVSGMVTVQRLLDAEATEPASYVLRPHQPGDLGWVVQQHGRVYAEEYGWTMAFEGLVAEIAGAFARNFDPDRERCWIAERDGVNVGSVFLVRESEEVARLRMLIVDRKARGVGIGRRLVQECTRFARGVGYRSIVLWTDSILGAARRLYATEGYRLLRSEPHNDFGQDLVGEHWELTL